MKRLLLILLLGVMIMACTPLPKCWAVTVNMPDGSTVDLSTLNDNERATMIKYIDKINKAKSDMPSIPEDVKTALGDTLTNPTKLDQWRKMITGTIKDVCNDLNVTVNEFIKTPVGMMVAGVLIYRFAGKDVLENTMDIVIMLPLWAICMIIWLFFFRYFFGSKLVYNITETTPEKGKKVIHKNDPKKILNYPWSSKDARCGAGWFFVLFPVLLTLTTIVIVLP
jgi:hypothetical protein